MGGGQARHSTGAALNTLSKAYLLLTGQPATT